MTIESKISSKSQEDRARTWNGSMKGAAHSVYKGTKCERNITANGAKTAPQMLIRRRIAGGRGRLKARCIGRGIGKRMLEAPWRDWLDWSKLMVNTSHRSGCAFALSYHKNSLIDTE